MKSNCDIWKAAGTNIEPTHAMITIDNPLQNIDLASLSGRDIADNLDMIKNALDSIKGIEAQLKDEAKTRLMKGESVKGYDIIKRSSPRKVKDINELFKLLSDYNIDSHMFIDACSISVSKLEGIYADVNKELEGGTKKQRIEEFKGVTKNLIEDGKITTGLRKI